MNALILCNGEPPSDDLLIRHLQQASLIICTDGAAGWVQERGCHPQVLIGDMDSCDDRVGRTSTFAVAGPASLEDRPTRECEIIPCGSHEQQENTDAEKAVLLALERGATRIVLLGATGQRLDHTLGNVWLAARYHDRAQVLLADEQCELRVVSGSCELRPEPGSLISLLALTADARLDTEGLKWPLHGPLEVGTRGLSNEPSGETVRIEVHEGMVAVMVVR